MWSPGRLASGPSSPLARRMHCHPLDKKELSFDTLDPSLYNCGVTNPDDAAAKTHLPAGMRPDGYTLFCR